MYVYIYIYMYTKHVFMNGKLLHLIRTALDGFPTTARDLPDCELKRHHKRNELTTATLWGLKYLKGLGFTGLGSGLGDLHRVCS